MSGSNSQHVGGEPEAPVHPLARYEFSAEELRVLRECDTESFFRRSLPLGTSFGLAAYMAVKNGMLSGSARFGAGPKVLIGSIVGYFIGKFSYQEQCAEKLMQLPDSKLGEMLKMRKRGGRPDSLTPDQGFGSALSLAPFSSATDHYSDVTGRSSSLNLDTERPTNSGLNDSDRPNLDSGVVHEEELKIAPGSGKSYDELRQRNREEYEKKRTNPYYRPIEGEQPPPINRPPPSATRPQDEPAGQRKKKNQYGDDWVD